MSSKQIEATTQQIIIIVDPLNAGHTLGLKALELGYRVIPIFTVPQYLVTEQVYTDFNVSLYHFETNLERVLRVIAHDCQRYGEQAKPVAVIPGSEPGVNLSIEIAAALNLPHNQPKVKHAFRDKYVMREVLRAQQLAQPVQHCCHTPAQAVESAAVIGYPVVVKPPFGAGSHLVYKCRNADDVRDKAQLILCQTNLFNQSNPVVLVEELIGGEEYVVDLFGLGDGSYGVLGVWLYDKDDNFLYQSATRIDHCKPQVKHLIDYAVTCAQVLGIGFGPSHSEIRDDPLKGATLIEVGTRLPGAGLAKFYFDCHGRDIFELTLAAFIHGQLEKTFVDCAYIPSSIMLPPVQFNGCGGVISHVGGLEAIAQLPSLLFIENKLQLGAVIGTSQSLGEQPVLIALSHHSQEQLQADIARIDDVFQVSCEELPQSIVLLLEEGIPSHCILFGSEQMARYHRNISGFTRTVPAVILPRNIDELRAVLRAANRSHGSIRLFPNGTGKNWSLGSKLPNQDGCMILDLRHMAEIQEINVEEGYVIVSPGVLWGGLSEYLQVHHPQFLINPLGGYGGSSLVSNCLERGDGLFGPRVDDIRGLEVMLADGNLYPAGGFWQKYLDGIINDPNLPLPSHFHPAGVGPNLMDAFVQSNFGIVVSMVYRLHPRGENAELVWGIFPKSKIQALYAAVLALVAAKIIDKNYSHLGIEIPTTPGEVTQKEGIQGITPMDTVGFTVLLSGDPDLVTLQRQKVLAALQSPVLEAQTVSVLKLTSPDVEAMIEQSPMHVKIFANLALGRPNWTRIAALYPNGAIHKHRYFLDADETPAGMVCFLPPIPVNTPEYIAHVIALIEKTCLPRNIQPIITIQIKGSAIVMLPFNREDPCATENAWACKRELYDAFMSRGIFPCRVDIEEQARVALGFKRHFELVSLFKKAIDPEGILAPGRYSLPDSK